MQPEICPSTRGIIFSIQLCMCLCPWRYAVLNMDCDDPELLHLSKIYPHPSNVYGYSYLNVVSRSFLNIRSMTNATQLRSQYATPPKWEPLCALCPLWPNIPLPESDQSVWVSEICLTPTRPCTVITNSSTSLCTHALIYNICSTVSLNIWGATPQRIMDQQNMMMKNRHSFTNINSYPKC